MTLVKSTGDKKVNLDFNKEFINTFSEKIQSSDIKFINQTLKDQHESDVANLIENLSNETRIKLIELEEFNIDPDIFIELNSTNKIKYHLPEGNLNIYQIKDGQKIFIGNKSFPKTSKGNQIYFHFKKSDDILHSFNQIEYEENNRGYKITIEAKFKNLKNKKSEIIWQEKPGKFAEIFNSSVDLNKENIFEFNANISLDIGETKKETLTLFIPKRD